MQCAPDGMASVWYGHWSVMVAMKKSEKKEEDFAVNEDFHSFIHPSGQFHFVFCSSEREGDGERSSCNIW